MRNLLSFKGADSFQLFFIACSFTGFSRGTDGAVHSRFYRSNSMAYSVKGVLIRSKADRHECGFSGFICHQPVLKGLCQNLSDKKFPDGNCRGAEKENRIKKQQPGWLILRGADRKKANMKNRPVINRSVY